MREFNTSGPCHPALHYTVMREALIAEGQKKVRKGQYFTIFAPRQTGKTTYFQLLLEAVKDDGFTQIWVSFEKLKTVTRELFYRDLNNQLRHELAEHQIKLKPTIKNQVELVELFLSLNTYCIKNNKLIILLNRIDEIKRLGMATK